MSTILSVQNLSIQYKNQSCCSVNSLSFDLKKEKRSAYMGIRSAEKHGCLDNHGKFVPWAVSLPEILCEGLDLVTCTEKQWREIRWKKLALVPQSSMNSFNPIYHWKNFR
ncbi:MAG: hypothetical protein ACLTE2_08385 [Eubacteriales bacterium]